MDNTHFKRFVHSRLFYWHKVNTQMWVTPELNISCVIQNQDKCIKCPVWNFNSLINYFNIDSCFTYQGFSIYQLLDLLGTSEGWTTSKILLTFSLEITEIATNSSDISEIIIEIRKYWPKSFWNQFFAPKYNENI